MGRIETGGAWEYAVAVEGCGCSSAIAYVVEGQGEAMAVYVAEGDRRCRSF